MMARRINPPQVKSLATLAPATLKPRVPDRISSRIPKLPDPALGEYSELNARFAWRASDKLELAVKGFNLLNETHLEYPDPAGQAIRRSVMAELRLNY